jgi:hypothetical protein
MQPDSGNSYQHILNKVIKEGFIGKIVAEKRYGGGATRSNSANR